MEPSSNEQESPKIEAVNAVKPAMLTTHAYLPKKHAFILGVYACIAVASVLIVAGVFAYISLQSLPDERLYGVKTATVEKAIGYTKFGASSRASYDITLLEARLSELKALHMDQSTTSPEALAVVMGSIESRAQDAITTLNNSSSIGGEVRVEKFSALVSIVNAEDTLIDETKEFSSMQERMQIVRSDATDSLKSAIQTFASSSPAEAVSEYLGIQVKTVGADIQKLAQGSTAQKLAIARIKDMNESMVDGNIADALTFILRARQAIAVDTYLFDSERGPVDGAQVESTEIPLGN